VTARLDAVASDSSSASATNHRRRLVMLTHASRARTTGWSVGRCACAALDAVLCSA
jgi:hypothetical protein